MPRSQACLDALSIGDAFGEMFFFPGPDAIRWIEDGVLPPGPWRWTDDTAQAACLLAHLRRHGQVQLDDLAWQLAQVYAADPRRGYGPTAQGVLGGILAGRDWREAAGELYDGHGSMGNGAAMRVAPLGVFFSDDLDQVVEQASLSALPTHTHPEAAASAVMVAVTAALSATTDLTGRELIAAVGPHIPESATREVWARAVEIPGDASVHQVTMALGNGGSLLAPDTAAFCVWCAAWHGWEDALRIAIEAEGDLDTTCAIIGGILGARSGPEGIPSEWLRRREPLRQ